MNKNFVFIVSHLQSGSKQVVHIMNKRDDFHIKIKKLNYKSPINVLKEIKKNKEKLICGAHLLFNQQFSSKELYKFCKFIFIIRSGKDAIEDMVKEKMPPQDAYRYYSFRLRRILEMAKCVPGALFLTHKNLTDKKGAKLIKNYLGAKSLFKKKKIKLLPVRTNFVPLELGQTADDCYSRYMEKFQELELLRV